MLVFTFISWLAVTSSTTKPPLVKATVKTAIPTLHPAKFILVTKTAVDNDFSFANESLPVNDEVVDKKNETHAVPAWL